MPAGASRIILRLPWLSQPKPDGRMMPTFPLVRRAFAVRERRGDPRDLPDFRCGAFHTCRRPYAGGCEAPTRCVRAPLPGFLVLSPSRHPPRPSRPAIPDGVIRFRRCIVRVMLRPAGLSSPPDWLRRRTGPTPSTSTAENRVTPAYHATCRHAALGVRPDGRTGNLPSLGLSPNQSQQLVRLQDSPEPVFTIRQNRCSRWPESAFKIDRRAQWLFDQFSSRQGGSS
jgi:hypothetical protein